MKKVTLQDIAESLGVSRISVWKVFSGRDGVSDELRKRIIAKASELNYNFPKDFELPDEFKPFQQPLNISVTVCRPENTLLWMDIIHEIAREFSKQNVNLIYTYLPNEVSEDYELPTKLTNGSLDGIIVMNVYNAELLDKLTKLSLPKVFLDCLCNAQFDDLHGDLVLSAGYFCVQKITEHIIKQGRTKIGFIGDINFARSTYDRYRGFVDAMNDQGVPVHDAWCYTDAYTMDSFENQLKEFIHRLDSLPEAFVCANDYIAYTLWGLLLKEGYRIPQDIFISGFDGIQEFAWAKDLTSVRVFSQTIGVRLATQILYKINNPTLRHELIYTSAEVVFGASTDGLL